IVLWLGHKAPTSAPPAKPTTAAIPACPPRPMGLIQKLCAGLHDWYVAAPIPAPTPAPTAPPMAALRKRCLFSMSFTLRTFGRWIVCSPSRVCSEIAVSETLTNDPETVLDFRTAT